MTKAYKYDVFISHSAATRAFARHLATELRKLEFHVWTPSRFTRQGSKTISRAMENSAVCILLFGPDGNSPWANKFVWSAISERIHRTDGKFRVIPVLLPTQDIRNDQLISQWKEPSKYRHQAGAFIRFENGLDEDAIRRLVVRIRGVDYSEDSIWNDAAFKEEIQRRAQNFLNVNWLTLANSEVDRFGSSSLVPLQLTITNKIMQERFGAAEGDLSSTANREASSTVSTNILVRTNGSWRADTTDPEVVHMAARERNVAVKQKRAAVIGCGGAGRAIAASLAHSGAEVTLINRGLQRGQFAARLLGLEYIPLPQFSATGYDIVVNATSVARDDNDAPSDLENLKDQGIVIDMVHGSRPTVNAARCSSLRRQVLQSIPSVAWVKECENISVFTDDAVGRRCQPSPFIDDHMSAYDRKVDVRGQLIIEIVGKSIRLMTRSQLFKNPIQHIVFNRDGSLDRKTLAVYDAAESRIAKDNDGPSVSWFDNRFHGNKIRTGLVMCTASRNAPKARQYWERFLTENRSSGCSKQAIAHLQSDIDGELAYIRALIDSCEIVGVTKEASVWKSGTGSFQDWFLMGTKNIRWLEPNQYFPVFMMGNERMCFVLDGLDDELIRLKTSPGLNLDGCGAFWQTQGFYHSKTDSMNDDTNTKGASVTSTSSDDDRLFDLLRVFGVHPAIVDRERRASS